MKEIISIKTDYSILESMIKIPCLISYAVENRINTLGIVDNNLGYVAEFVKLCNKNNIKYIIGLEVKYKDTNIYLYAKNEDGYKDLLKINTYLLDNDFDIKFLTDNIIVVILYKDRDLYGHFKNVYIGYNSDTEKEELKNITNNLVYFNLALSLTKNNTKYINYLNMIKDNKTYDNYNDKDYSDNYLKIEDISNFTKEIDIKIQNNDNLIPHYDDNIEDSYKFLEALAIKGLNKRLNGVVPLKYKERLLYELGVIKKMGYVDYFLIVYDYVKYAIKNDIYVGPGRGSAVGSLVTYSLGITAIDPLKYDLLFERFLNPERITMPDIDIDFDATKRDLVIDYVKDRYGKKNVYPVMTYGTMTTKQVLLSVSKILRVDISSLSKHIKSNLTLKENLNKEIIKIINSNKDIKEVYYDAMQLEGIKKHIGTNAAGVVICKKELDNVIPIVKSGSDYLAGFTKDYLEDLGLLKMDFLSIANLTSIADILKMIPDKININSVPLDDKKVYEKFAKAETNGIFQFESSGMKNLLRKIKPTCFSDLVVALGLIRPGANTHIDTFARRKEGKEKITYLDDSLEDILKETYGIIIYQEQIMQIFRKVALYSFSEADLIRRAISKKNEDIILGEREKFLTRAIDNGYSKEVSEEIFSLILKFAEYGFNKSHSVGYALIAYQMMYLKVNYPLYFYKSVLDISSTSGTKTKKYLDELKSLGYKVYKPDVNISDYNYKIVSDGLIMPLNLIKEVGDMTVKDIFTNRPYDNFFDFVSKTYGMRVNSKTIENLIYAGALDSFNETRKTLIENLNSALIYSELVNGLDSSLINKPDFNRTEEFDKQILMNKELELYGFYVSNHPASKYLCPKSNELALNFNKYVEIYGLVESIKIIKTKNGDSMAFINLSDEAGIFETTIFPKRIDYVNYLKSGDLVKIYGQVQKRFDKYQIILEKLEKIKI